MISYLYFSNVSSAVIIDSYLQILPGLYYLFDIFPSLICTLIRKSQAPCKIYLFQGGKSTSTKKHLTFSRAWHPFFSDLSFEIQLFHRLAPQKISGPYATLTKNSVDFTGYPSNHFPRCRTVEYIFETKELLTNLITAKYCQHGSAMYEKKTYCFNGPKFVSKVAFSFSSFHKMITVRSKDCFFYRCLSQRTLHRFGSNS